MKTGVLAQMTRVRDALYAGEGYLKRQGLYAAQQEAEALLQSVLSCRKLDLYLDSKRALLGTEQTAFSDLLERRGRREPLQYLLGEVEFCEIPLFIAPGVFIPRPETEQIVQRVTSCLSPPRAILDLCTGSGALAIALAMQFPSANITAIDCSEKALAIARFNQTRHRQTIVFMKGDLVSPLKSDDQFDLIVSNPPYIAEQERSLMDPEVRLYEPPEALFSPDGGQFHLKRILRATPRFLAPGGSLLLEIGAGQSLGLLDFIKRETPFTAEVLPDEAGIDRILHCRYG